MGVEPTTSRATIWRSNQLSYTHQKYVVCLKGFEPLTYALEGRCSIQLRYRHIGCDFLQMAGAEGFEPSNVGVRVPCLTTWRHPTASCKKLAGVAGFEPTNARVKVSCLTAWRHPNDGFEKLPYSQNFYGAGDGNRTHAISLEG